MNEQLNKSSDMSKSENCIPSISILFFFNKWPIFYRTQAVILGLSYLHWYNRGFLPSVLSPNPLLASAFMLTNNMHSFYTYQITCKIRQHIFINHTVHWFAFFYIVQILVLNWHLWMLKSWAYLFIFCACKRWSMGSFYKRHFYMCRLLVWGLFGFVL